MSKETEEVYVKSQVGDKEKNSVSLKESNLRPFDSELRCPSTELLKW